jgi:hypothetical protein
MPRPLAYRHSLPSPIDVAWSFWKPVTKSCSSYPLYRLKYVGLNSRWVSYVTTTLQLKIFVLKRSRHRAMTAPSPRCRKTTVFKYWRTIHCIPQVGRRFGDGDGYRSKGPINVSNVPFPIFFAQRFPVWKWRIHLLYMFRLCGSPVSWVRWFGASVLALFAPNGLQQAPWGVFDRLLANKSESDCSSSHFFE